MNLNKKKIIIILGAILIIFGLSFYIVKKYFNEPIINLKHLETPENYQVDLLYAEGDNEHYYRGTYENNTFSLEDAETSETYSFENIYESLKSYIMNRKYYYGRTVNVTVSKDSFLSDNEIFNVFSDLDCIYYISDNKITKVECLNKNHEYFRFIFDF